MLVDDRPASRRTARTSWRSATAATRLACPRRQGDRWVGRVAVDPAAASRSPASSPRPTSSARLARTRLLEGSPGGAAPRAPRGAGGAHVADLLETIERWGETGRRAELRFLALVHDSLKFRSRTGCEARGEPPRDAGARFAERYTDDERLLATIELHDRPYTSGEGPDGRRADRPSGEMLAGPRPGPVPPLRRAGRLHRGQEPRADRLAEGGARGGAGAWRA